MTVDLAVSTAAATIGSDLAAASSRAAQGALLATSKIVQTVPWEEAKFYAASQVMDEARHVEVYHRYLTEKLGLSYEIHPSLKSLLDDIVSDSRWDVTYLGMQVLIEGVALAAFGLIRDYAGNPLSKSVTRTGMASSTKISWPSLVRLMISPATTSLLSSVCQNSS